MDNTLNKDILCFKERLLGGLALKERNISCHFFYFLDLYLRSNIALILLRVLFIWVFTVLTEIFSASAISS
jgi:hypothetical protein